MCVPAALVSDGILTDWNGHDDKITGDMECRTSPPDVGGLAIDGLTRPKQAPVPVEIHSEHLSAYVVVVSGFRVYQT